MSNLGNMNLAVFGGLIGLVVFIIMLSCAAAAITIVANWKIFKKAGVPGWMSIVPFLNIYKAFEIAWNKKMGVAAIVLTAIVTGLSSITSIVTNAFVIFENLEMADSVRLSSSASAGWLAAVFVLAVLTIIPTIILTVLSIIQTVKLGRAFGKSGGFIAGLILLPVVFNTILAFDRSVYHGPQDY
ncbi:MAG: hypothetical protein J5544_05105 [Clostridia bacterium]|nr:hypothetical protein [Clostridia bacterium]